MVLWIKYTTILPRITYPWCVSFGYYRLKIRVYRCNHRQSAGHNLAPVCSCGRRPCLRSVRSGVRNCLHTASGPVPSAHPAQDCCCVAHACYAISREVGAWPRADTACALCQLCCRHQSHPRLTPLRHRGTCSSVDTRLRLAKNGCQISHPHFLPEL